MGGCRIETGMNSTAVEASKNIPSRSKKKKRKDYCISNADRLTNACLLKGATTPEVRHTTGTRTVTNTSMSKHSSSTERKEEGARSGETFIDLCQFLGK